MVVLAKRPVRKTLESVVLVALALVAALLGGLDASPVRAATDVWSAPLNDPKLPQAGVGYWNNPKDWSLGRLPTATDNVTYPNGAGIMFLNVNATVNNFTQSGAASYLQGNPYKVGPGFDLTVNGMFTWSGGTEANARGAPNGSTILKGGFAISGTKDAKGAVLEPTLNGRTLDINSSGTLSGGGLSGSNGALILNRFGGIFRITDDSSLSYTGIGARPIFINNDTFAKTGGTGTSSVGWVFQNYGNVDAMSGTIKFVNFTQYAGNTRLLGGNLASTYASMPLNFQGGALTGTGKIDGRAVVNGVLAPVGLAPAPAPGGAGALAAAALVGGGAGKIEFTGGLVMQSGANMMMRIGGAAPGQSDFIQVDADTTLAGLLSLSFMNGFQNEVTPYDVITILTGASPIMGAYSDVANGGRLETTDGFGSFQVNYGSGSAFGPDSVVLSNYLPDSGNLNVAAVPEPSSLVLLGSGLLGALSCCAWRRLRRPS